LLLLAAVFVSIGLFASATTNNQIVALITGVLLCTFSFYGFDLLSGLFSSGKIQFVISSIGLSGYYNQMQQGVVSLNGIFAVLIYLYIFYKLSLVFLIPYKSRMICVDLFIIAILVVPSMVFEWRADLTSDKRYTISNYTKTLLKRVEVENKSFEVKIYLDGELNAGFMRLRNATQDLLRDFEKESGSVHSSFLNPYAIYGSPEDVYRHMTEQDMPGIVLNEVDREGRLSRKVIYPYAQVIHETDTLVVPLLKNIQGYTAEENLNASVESLEYEFADAIHLLKQQIPQAVAFIEGHGEIPRANVYDAEEQLAKYYSVHRGQVGNQVGILDDFDVAVIAGPTEQYSEQEKYVIDQYIMSGGKVLWLVDGAYTSMEEINTKGHAASMKLDTNLDDLLFTYGVRINSDFVQDKQCVPIMLVPDGDVSRTLKVPCFYMPLLIPSYDHIVTRNIRDVKSAFGSSIDLVNNRADIKKSVLLTSSGNTHLVDVPETITFDVEDIQSEDGYFNNSYIPMAVAMEGSFTSAYENRLIPEGVESAGMQRRNKGELSKMIVVSSSNVIRNDLEVVGADTQIIPVGYDRILNQQFGNREFIVNAVNWLAGNEELMALRSKQRKMFLLDKSKVYEERDKYAALNIGIPVLFMLMIIGGVSFYRKRKYER
jgi:ABC-2 type transport system permease protein